MRPSKLAAIRIGITNMQHFMHPDTYEVRTLADWLAAGADVCTFWEVEQDASGDWYPVPQMFGAY
jgi:hypothetical protein